MKKLLSKVINIIVAITALWGCSSPTKLDKALSQAGDNRNELQHVLDHYSNDSLKYAAAVFLIENMPYRYSLEGDELTTLYKYYSAASLSELTPQEVNDSIVKTGTIFNAARLKIKPDIQHVKSEFLIDHIDAAFEIMESRPWRNQIDFATFCNHILPYRVGNEQLKPWMRELNSRFSPLLDSIMSTPDSTNMLKAAEAVLSQLQKLPRHYGHGLPSGVTIGPDNTKWMAGDCREFTDIFTFIMRSLGFPAGCDKMPMNGKYFLPHFWNYLLTGDGATSYGSILYKTPRFAPSETYAGPTGKVMREKFGLNEVIYNRLDRYRKKESIPPAFMLFTDEDVTRLYAGDSIMDAVIPKEKCHDLPKSGEPVFVCLSSHLDWVPVDVAINDGATITVKDLDAGVVLRLCVYRDNRQFFISRPFFVDKKSQEIRFFEPADSNEEVCIYYKYDDIFRENFSPAMIGGVFEASNSKDFNQRDTIYQITSPPRRLYSGATSRIRSKAYRYVRYYGPENGKCYVAEITFFGHAPGSDHTVQLTGKCIGTPNFHSDNKYPYTNVVDGNPYTSFVYEQLSGGWVGLDLGTAMVIDSINYTPRNRRNFIEAGDDYELFYCNRSGWESLGRKRADADSLLFSAPKGALLYLKNHSQGNQERIFEYSGDKQIFY